MGKQSSVFLALAILATIAAGVGFFLFYQKQQEILSLYEKSEQLTSRLDTSEEKLRQAEDALKASQMKLQQSSRTLQAPADQSKITSLEQELQRATDELRALQAQYASQAATVEQINTFQDVIADQQQQIDGLTAELQDQQQAVAALTAENAALKTAAAQAMQTPEEQPALTKTPVESDAQQAERETLMASVKEKEAKIDELLRQLTQNQTRLSEVETQLAEKQAVSSPQVSETPLPSAQSTPSNHEQVKLLKTLQAELTALTQKTAEQQRVMQDAFSALQQQNQEYQQQLAESQQQNQEYQKQLMELQQQQQDAQKQLAELQQQYQQHQEQFSVLQQENQRNQEALTVLKQQNQEHLATIQAVRANATSLQADLDAREEEYRKLKETHDLSLANLQAEISNENIEKETIQARLREELERSNKEYQERLDNLAKKKEEEIQQLKSVAETYLNLSRDLEKQIEDKTVRIEQIQEKLRVVIVDQILFASGSAQISGDGIKVLKTIGEELKRNLDGRQIGIEGHTDNQVISKRLQRRYASNWELSSARATNVLRYLQEALKIPGSQLFAVGYGSHRPVADNSTEEGRRLNRRIEIVLTPQLERSKKEE